eukprot:9248530-Alexandrium_andersonii.AAC.1
MNKYAESTPSRASGANFEAVSGPAQVQVRTPQAIFAFSINAGSTRLDRFDSLLDSIGLRFACHRVPPWFRWPRLMLIES